jgi:hypothetical protein
LKKGHAIITPSNPKNSFQGTAHKGCGLRISSHPEILISGWKLINEGIIFALKIHSEQQ